MRTPPPQNPDPVAGRTRVADAAGRAEDQPMHVVALPPPARLGTERCECAGCGAHVTVRRSWQLSGQCGNCRGYDLRPLDVPAPPAMPPLSAVPLAQRWVA